MAFVGVTQYNHNQQIDEYEYDETENFYDDGALFGSYLDVDDSEGEKKTITIKGKSISLKSTFVSMHILFV